MAFSLGDKCVGSFLAAFSCQLLAFGFQLSGKSRAEDPETIHFLPYTSPRTTTLSPKACFAGSKSQKSKYQKTTLIALYSLQTAH